MFRNLWYIQEVSEVNTTKKITQDGVIKRKMIENWYEKLTVCWWLWSHDSSRPNSGQEFWIWLPSFKDYPLSWVCGIAIPMSRITLTLSLSIHTLLFLMKRYGNFNWNWVLSLFHAQISSMNYLRITGITYVGRSYFFLL